MKKIKNAAYSPNKYINIAITLIAVFMLFFSFLSLTFNFAGEVAAVELSFNNFASFISIIPLTIVLSNILLMKTKKDVFAKIPAYAICFAIALAYIIYFISLGEDGIATGIIALTFVALLAYPLIVYVLTIEGRVYNRVFSLAFTGVLIFIAAAAFIIISIYLKAIMISLLLPALMYLEFLLLILNFQLEPIKKEKSEYESII